MKEDGQVYNRLDHLQGKHRAFSDVREVIWHTKSPHGMQRPLYFFYLLHHYI
ncbi:hypothetical protein ACFLXU_07520 [Chloroflexota bacterium]